MTGISSTSLSFRSSRSFDILNINFPNTYSVVAGVFADFILPRNERKWSIYNELLYSHYTVSEGFKDFTNENNYRNVEGELGYSYLKVNNMVRFRYPLGSFKVFANGGLSNGYAFKETNNKTTVNKFHNSETIEEGKLLDKTRRYEQGLILGLGAIKGRLSGEFRYERGNGMSDYIYLGVRTDRFFLLANYRLN